MTTAEERTRMIDQIRRLPDQIEYLAGVLSPAEVSGHFLAGEWSAAQNIHHLADSHMVSFVRCHLMLTEEDPFLKPYDQDRWAALPDSLDNDVTTSVQILRGLHARWVRFWNSLPEEAWERTGDHPERGLVTIEDQLKLYSGHGQGHVDQIRRTVAAQYPEFPATLEELLARLDREWERLNSLVRRMTPQQLETRLDNGWAPKDHLAHVSAWERFLIGYVINEQPAHTALGLAAEDLDPWDVNKLNDLILQASGGKALEDILAEYNGVHEQARAAVAGITWAEWHEQTRELNGEHEPRLGWITSNCYDHYLEHWQWLPVV